MFEAVILAGGMGTRLKSLSGATPKPMMEVAGQPFLYRLMQKLEAEGCEQIHLAISYKANYVIDCIKQDNPTKIDIRFSVEQAPLGTGGAVRQAVDSVNSDHFLILNGDSFTDLNFNDVFEFSPADDVVIAATNVKNAGRFGAIKVNNNGHVECFVEKGQHGPGLINCGIYRLCKDKILELPGGPFSLEDDYIKVTPHPIRVFETDGFFVDIGIPEDFHVAVRHFK
jgi:D-glycero-alpha-D-manno-heptose 1-phosphate guanylyltransferase